MGSTGNLTGKGYGTTPGQLGAMPALVPGTGKGRPAVVSSPPFAGNSGGRGEASRNGIDPALFDRHQGAMVGGIGSVGNLAGLKPGDVAVVTSPPFADSLQSQDFEFENRRQAARGRNINGAGHKGSLATYGQTEGQLGAMKGEGESETFWSAAAVIISQCHQLLPPGAPAVWVVKSFVRDGAIVDFPGQWQALCESCGFETVEVIRAWLVKDKGTQVGLNGEQVRKTVKRSSFFRRIYERKYPHLSIDYEVVLITRKVQQ